MAEETKIEWCDRTWSPWVGCQPVSPGCEHCYARAIQRRFKLYGPVDGSYRLTAHSGWEKLRLWDRVAEKAGRRVTVFPSMCDPFDGRVQMNWRKAFYRMVAYTPNLVWLLLTKRPVEAKRCFAEVEELQRANAIHRNVWLGVTVEDQERAEERIPVVLDAPVENVFLSVEPMLGPVDIPATVLKALDWVIVGGETGPGWRPMHVRWAADLLEACQCSGVPLFFKQWAGKRSPRGCLPFSCAALEKSQAFPEGLR